MSKLRGSGSDRRICSVLVLLTLPTITSATTWRVTFDPAQPEDRIGAVVAQAISGDSILIDPGTYYEHVSLDRKSLTFVGIGGAAATILDGSRDFPGREGSIIYCLTSTSAHLALEGLTLRGGTGALWTMTSGSVVGGAVCLWRSPSMGGSLSVVNCVLEDNSTYNSVHPWEWGGGAIFAWGLLDVRVEGSSFAQNATGEDGGDIYLSSGTMTIKNCFFDVNRGAADAGASIYCEGLGRLTIQGCTFESEDGDGYYRSCMFAEASRIEILDSRFLDYGPGLAARMAFGYGGVGSPRQQVVMARNLFWNAAGPDTAWNVSIAMPNGDFDISENTFYRCGMAIENGSGPEITFERNVVARAEVRLFIPSGGVVQCCDFWRTRVIEDIGNLTLSDNLSEDPLFCDEQAGDLRIAFQSPCAAENSPSGCGRIGALDPACDITPARQMSWGNIKALFRGER